MDPHVGGMKHFFQIGLLSAVFTLAAWPIFEWKGLVAFVPFWAFFEVVYRIRLRAVLTCPHCGFDPVLYMRDVKAARAEIEKFWRAKFAEKGMPWPGETAETKPGEGAVASNAKNQSDTAGNSAQRPAAPSQSP